MAASLCGLLSTRCLALHVTRSDITEELLLYSGGVAFSCRFTHSSNVWSQGWWHLKRKSIHHLKCIWVTFNRPRDFTDLFIDWRRKDRLSWHCNSSTATLIWPMLIECKRKKKNLLFYSYLCLFGGSPGHRAKEPLQSNQCFSLHFIIVMQQAVKLPKHVLVLQTANIRAPFLDLAVNRESLLHNYIKDGAL